LILVLDAGNATAVADFWAAALHYDRQQPLGHFEILTPPDGSPAPVMLIQAVDVPTPGKNRMHLDLHVVDPEAEAERLIALGEIRWIAMTDPEGNEFDIGWE
jgi:hypothetical protein